MVSRIDASFLLQLPNSGIFIVHCHIMKDVDIVGVALAEVLPQTNKYWFQIPHLRRLNLILLIPLLSSAVAGYDGNLLLPIE